MEILLLHQPAHRRPLDGLALVETQAEPTSRGCHDMAGIHEHVRFLGIRACHDGGSTFGRRSSQRSGCRLVVACHNRTVGRRRRAVCPKRRPLFDDEATGDHSGEDVSNEDDVYFLGGKHVACGRVLVVGVLFPNVSPTP